MEKQCQVVLVGNSVFMAGVEATLSNRRGLNVVRIDSTLPDLEHLTIRCPDVIVFDIASPHWKFVLPLLKEHPYLRLIGLDVANNAVVVLSGQWYIGLTASDLAQIIQEEEK